MLYVNCPLAGGIAVGADLRVCPFWCKHMVCPFWVQIHRFAVLGAHIGAPLRIPATNVNRFYRNVKYRQTILNANCANSRELTQ